MRYPLDKQGVGEIVRDLLATDEANRLIISRLLTFLELAIGYGAGENADWYPDAKRQMDEIYQRNKDFESFRFDQGNGHKLGQTSPYDKPSASTSEGGEWSEKELAEHFRQPLPTYENNRKKEKPISKMTLEEIEEWEKKQDNSNDIYKVAARVKNLARAGAGDNAGNLTDVGEMLSNCYVHVLVSLYNFAESLEDKETKIKLMELIRSNEGMPANFIGAVHAGVNTKKS